MRDIFKKYWLAIIIIVFVPIILNYVITKPAFFEFVGNDTDWLNFWAVYISTILSSFIAFYVLHKQLQQNHEENEENRILQIDIIEYQQRIMWLTELKVKMTEYFKAFSQNDILMLGNKYLRFKEKDNINNEIKRMIDIMSHASFSKGLLFPNEMEDFEKKCLSELGRFENEFYALLEDLNSLANLLGNNSNKVQDSIKKFEQETRLPKVRSRRIWDINDENVQSIYVLANTRINEAVKNLTPDDIQKTIIKLIDYEQNKINSIIKLQNNKLS